ncbi:MAG TPA: hypothetical protein IAD10_00875 [Candidatus Fimicola cottocaccae]|nr:hypothetical protein [Candidatus Fimicola cottocaccae]
MKLEEATKEDLIYWIVSNGLEPDEEDFTEAIKQYREAIYNEKMARLKQAYNMAKDIIDKHNLTDKELLYWQDYLHLLKNRMEIAENEFKEFKEVLNRQENNFELVE